MAASRHFGDRALTDSALPLNMTLTRCESNTEAFLGAKPATVPYAL